MSTTAIRTDSFGITHRGRVRSLNEDRFLMEPESGLWLVADGMGGHDAGDMASSSIVTHLASIGQATSGRDLRARFEDRLNRAHAEIRGLARSRNSTIGSTIAALLAFDGAFACLWSGDSRIYLVRHRQIMQVSRDHTEVQDLLDRGAISPEEALTWPRRNVITRAIGVTEDVVVEAEQGLIAPGDIFVIASDGLTAHVADDEIEAVVLDHHPKQACEVLLEMVLERGGTDNVTIIVVRTSGFDDASEANRPVLGRNGSWLE